MQYLIDNRNRLMDIFTEMDRNGDGLLTYTEFVIGFNKLGIRAEDGVLDRIWNYADINNTKTLEYTEFFALLSSVKKALTDEIIECTNHYPSIISVKKYLF